MGNKTLRHWCVAVLLAGSAIGAGAQELPKTMIWTSYDLGASGYAEASAIADAFGRQYGTRVRIQPSGSGIGRLQPVLTGRADLGFLATETFFATEGLFDFADRRFGPQDLRVLVGKPNSFDMATAADAGIETVADVKGKRVAYAAGNPSANLKCDAILAFAGLTRDDVNAIMFPTYAAAMSSLSENKADATCTVTATGQMYELAESPRGIHWLTLDPDDREGWDRLSAVAPLFTPVSESHGAGLKEGEPVDMMAYRYPVLVTRGDTSDDEAYAITKALDETYDLYKNATATASRYELSKSGKPPIDAPFHPGAVRYLKEKGIWTDADTQWNEARLARLEALRTAWDKAVDEGQDMSDDEFADLWAKRRQQTLAGLQ
ncbi:TAXI family TRAP transporter solute-binding subunit [Salinisphaera sp. T31B1]|uniref:TAXI family TRAP transporter solute-binding subunit n=1 Tax=Salinisphaera sp. T31B1 TaxID=727963 RepID=UPI00333EEBD5